MSHRSESDQLNCLDVWRLASRTSHICNNINKAKVKIQIHKAKKLSLIRPIILSRRINWNVYLQYSLKRYYKFAIARRVLRGPYHSQSQLNSSCCLSIYRAHSQTGFLNKRGQRHSNVWSNSMIISLGSLIWTNYIWADCKIFITILSTAMAAGDWTCQYL